MRHPSPGAELIPSERMEGRALVVAICGEIDLHNSPALRGRLLDLVARNDPDRLVANLSQVPYMDSSGVAVFVELLRRLRKGGGSISLVSLQPRVQSILEIARLGTVFQIAKDEQEALVRPESGKTAGI